MRFYQNIRFKILTCCVCISIIPTLIIFLFTMKTYNKAYTNQIETVTKHAVQNTTDSIERNIKNIESLETELLFNQYDGQSVFISICDQETPSNRISSLKRLQNSRSFDYVCSNLTSTTPYAQGVYLFTNSGYTYSYMKNSDFWLEKTAPNTGWRKTLNSNEDGSLIQSFVPEHFDSSQKYIMFAKKFRNLAGKASGTLVIVCDKSILNQDSYSSSSTGISCVILHNGEMLYNWNQRLNLTTSQMNYIFSQDNGYIISDNQELITFGTLKDLGWKTVSKVSYSPFYTAYEQNRTFLLWILFVVLVVVAFLVYEMEKRFVSPLVKLSRSMKVTQGAEIVSFENTCSNRKDEIGILYKCFESLLKQIHNLIDDKYKSEIRYLKSRLQNLMSQINVHFLFNTLENINDCALIEHNEKIAIMSKSLGDILRYSIDYETDEVPLQTELEQAQKYINIQEVKFGHPIQFTADVEECLLQHKVMKFFLQPIIENAIEHGMPGAEGRIELKACHHDGIISISVFDNGQTISPERLQQINRRISTKDKLTIDKKSIGVGLANINRRLKLLYSMQYGLSIQNCEEDGVIVMVTMPF